MDSPPPGFLSKAKTLIALVKRPRSSGNVSYHIRSAENVKTRLAGSGHRSKSATGFVALLFVVSSYLYVPVLVAESFLSR